MRWTVRLLAAALAAVVLLSCDGAPPVAAARPYGWPITPRPAVVRGFDPPEKRWQAGHRGVDLAAAAGTQVLAAGAGVVSFAGSVAGKPTVSIRHPDGLLTTYEPVTATVAAGDPVGRGSPIGRLEPGHAGCPAPVCLHWGARRGSGSSAVYINPLTLVGALRVRLKPVRPAA